MKLYLIRRDNEWGYDEYEGAVVAAKSPKDAVKIHPDGSANNLKNPVRTWVPPRLVSATYLGPAKKGTKRGVILASFHAG